MTNIEMHKKLQDFYIKKLSTKDIANTPVIEHLLCPLPIDRDNPESGLWGMIDWIKWCFTVNREGELIIYDRDDIYHEYHSQDPETALLKALIEHKCKEVKHDRKQ